MLHQRSRLRCGGNKAISYHHIWILFHSSTSQKGRTLCQGKKWKRRGLNCWSPSQKERIDDDAALIRHFPSAETEAKGDSPAGAKPPLVVTDAEEILTRNPKRKENATGKSEPTIPNQREITMCSRFSQQIRIVTYAG